MFLPVLVLGPGTLCAAEVTGKPRVVDGDTFVIEGRKIRISGIGAPENDQVCLDQKGAK